MLFLQDVEAGETLDDESLEDAEVRRSRYNIFKHVLCRVVVPCMLSYAAEVACIITAKGVQIEGCTVKHQWS